MYQSDFKAASRRSSFAYNSVHFKRAVCIAIHVFFVVFTPDARPLWHMCGMYHGGSTTHAPLRQHLLCGKFPIVTEILKTICELKYKMDDYYINGKLIYAIDSIFNYMPCLCLSEEYQLSENSKSKDLKIGSCQPNQIPLPRPRLKPSCNLNPYPNQIKPWAKECGRSKWKA